MKRRKKSIFNKIITLLVVLFMLFNSTGISRVIAEDEQNGGENTSEVLNDDENLGSLDKQDEKDDDSKKSEEENIGKDSEKSEEKEDIKKDSELEDDVVSIPLENKKSGDSKNTDGDTRNGDDPTDSDPYFDIYWITPYDQATDTDVAEHVIGIKNTPQTDSYGSGMPYVQAQVEFQIGRAGDPIKAGDIKIVLPRYLFTQWDWDDDGSSEKEKRELKVGVGYKPQQTGKDFYYYFANKGTDDKYVEDINGEYIIISNYVEYSSQYNTPKEFTCTISYPYIPSRIVDDQVYELNAEYIVETEGYTVNQNNTRITAEIHTSAKLTSVNKGFLQRENGTLINFDTWDDRWGDFVDTGLQGSPEDYVYVPSIISATVHSDNGTSGPTQPFYLRVTEETPGNDFAEGSVEYKGNNKGTIIGYSNWNSGSGHYPSSSSFRTLKELENDGNIDIDPETGAPICNIFGYIAKTETVDNDTARDSHISGTSYSISSLVAYPKDYYDMLKGVTDDPLPGENDYLTNSATVEMQKYDKDEPQSSSSNAKARDQVVDFKYHVGLFDATKYQYKGGLNSVIPTNPKEAGEVGKGHSPTNDFILFQGEDEDDDPRTDMTKPFAMLQGTKMQLLDGNSIQLLPYFIGDNVPVEADPSGTLLGSFYWQLTQEDPDYTPGNIVTVTDTGVYGFNKYTLELMDDIVFLDGEQLLPGDYEIVKALYRESGTYYFDEYDFSFKSLNKLKEDHPDDEEIQAMEDVKPDIYVRYSHDEDWILLKEGAEISASFDGINTYDVPKNSAGIGASEVKFSFTTDAAALSPDCYLIIQLNPTEHVLDIASKNDGELQVINVASFSLRDVNGKQWNLWDETTMEGLKDITDVVKNSDQTGGYDLPEDMYLSHERTYQYLTGINSETTFDKYLSTSSDDYMTLTSYRKYVLSSKQNIVLYSENPEATLQSLDDAGFKYGQKDIVFYDLIPQGAILDVSKLKALYNSNKGGGVVGDISYETIPNYKDSGQTMLIVNVKFPDGQDESWGQKYDDVNHQLDLSTIVYLEINLVYPWEDISLLIPSEDNQKYRSRNVGAVYVPGSDDGFDDSPERPVDPRIDPALDGLPEQPYFDDLHGGKDSEEYDTYYDLAETTFNIASASITGYSKYVRAESETSYRINSAVKAGEKYSYRLKYSVESNTMAKNIVIYDVLEYAWIDEAFLTGDFKEKFDLTGRYWLGRFDSVDVSQVEKLGVDAKVYYSTTDREVMQNGLDQYSGAGETTSEYADLNNTTYWTISTPDELANMSEEEKKAITALAFDFRKMKDGSDFILEYDPNGKSAIQTFVYMVAPDEEEVEKGWDDQGSYVDPELVYAYNNSFLASQTSNGSEWTANGARMSDGTTVRITEPHPDIYKKVEDSDEEAGATNKDDMTENDGVVLNDRNEIIKYTINTKVPTFGVEVSGENTRNSFTLNDQLVNELEFADLEKIKLTIGDYSKKENFLGYDPDAVYDGHKGYMRIETGTVDEQGNKEFEEVYFDSLLDMPDGIDLIVNGNNSYEYEKNTVTANTISLKLSYEEYYNEQTYKYEYVLGGYDRVSDFQGSKIVLDFYAKVRDGASLGAYADNRIPNTAKYVIPNKPGNSSNTVYVEVDEETPNPEKKVALVNDNGSTNEYADHQDLDELYQTVRYAVDAVIPFEHKSLSVSDNVVDVLEIDEESLKLHFTGIVIVNEYNTREGQQYDYYGRPVWDYQSFYNEGYTNDDIIYDSDGRPTNVPPKMTTYYDYVLDDDGNPKTKELEIDRILDIDDIRFLSNSSYGLKAEVNSSSIKVDFDENFINMYGDYIISGELEEYTYTNYNNEELTSYRWIAGEYGTVSIHNVLDYCTAGLNVRVLFDANIKKDADLEPYKVDDKTKVPNTAEYKFGDNPSQETEPVTITPPEDTPDIEKKVNGKQHEDLAEFAEIFEYTLTANIVRKANKIVITDTLEDVLEYVGNPVVTIAGEKVDGVIDINGQTLTITINEDRLKDKAGEVIVVTFKARIKANISLLDYIVDGEIVIPNTAELQLNNNPKIKYSSNTVDVKIPKKNNNNNKKYQLPKTGVE